MKHPRRPWTAAEDDTLRRLYPTTASAEIGAAIGRPCSSVYYRAGKLGLRKSTDWIREESRRQMERPEHGGRKSQFRAGQKPWNTGTHYKAGGRSVATQFKRGQKPHTWNPIGHERITKDGYLQRKVSDTGYTPHDYRMAHHLVWEAHHGPLPPGHALCFIDGDKTRIELDNLELVSRAELMRRNTVHNLPAPLVEVIRMRAGILKRINRMERRRGQTAHD